MLSSEQLTDLLTYAKLAKKIDMGKIQLFPDSVITMCQEILESRRLKNEESGHTMLDGGPIVRDLPVS